MTEKVVRKRPLGQSPARMLGHGMDPMDYLKLTERTEKGGEDFVDVCHEMGDAAYDYAVSELEKGHKVTASTFFLNASALYRLGDYGLTEKTEEKLTLYRKLVDSFERGKALDIYEKPIKVEIPFMHSTMPGWLMIPENAPKDVPVGIVIPGATGFKEENYISAYRLWERGLAALIFDGPGQGEAMLFRDYYYDLTNYEKAVKAVIDFVRAYPDVGDRVGLYGISYGGYLAARTACFYNDEIDCVVSRGGTDDTALLIANDMIKPVVLHKFMMKFNTDDEEEAERLMRQMTIVEETKNITCPLLVLHTEHDFVLSVEGARRLYENASSEDKELKLFPGPVHCADDDDVKAGSYIADWMAERLLG